MTAPRSEVGPYFDLTELKKGDWIPPEQCEYKLGLRRQDRNYQFKLLSLQRSLERHWLMEFGEKITTRIDRDGILICTDDDALVTNQRRVRQRISGLERDHERIGGIDRARLSSDALRNKHDRALSVVGAFLAAGHAAVKAALKPSAHVRAVPGLDSK